ncbi:MAG: tRNA lysidine(34) synthetase TilS [Pseudomonadota bacterium]
MSTPAAETPVTTAAIVAAIDATLAATGVWPGCRLAVAYSGGADSSALLHALAASAHRDAVGAVHVNHGLQPGADAWARHCARICERLGLPFALLPAAVETAPGDSVEAAARQARYRALAAWLPAGTVLLTAQHADDQTETLLLQLLRGAGPAGLAAMPPLKPFGAGFLARPLLGLSRAGLAEYVVRKRLDVIEDPSNADERFDRNYLRRRVVPALVERWPGAVTAIGRSARLSAETVALADAWARHERRRLAGVAATLPVATLQAAGSARCRAIVRTWIRDDGRRVPPSRRLAAFVDSLETAGPESRAELVWDDGVVRTFAMRLYLGDALPPFDTAAEFELAPGSPLDLPAGLGTLVLGDAAPHAALKVRFRHGGERLRRGPGRPERRVKSVLRELGVVPWLRDRIPLLYAGETLVALGDLALNEAYFTAGGEALGWRDRPPVY